MQFFIVKYYRSRVMLGGFRSSGGVLHMKIVRHNSSYILGQFSQPFDSVPEMVQFFSQGKLPIRGTDEICLVHPVICSKQWCVFRLVLLHFCAGTITNASLCTFCMVLWHFINISYTSKVLGSVVPTSLKLPLGSISLKVTLKSPLIRISLHTSKLSAA